MLLLVALVCLPAAGRSSPGPAWGFEAAGSVSVGAGTDAALGRDLRLGFRRRVPYDSAPAPVWFGNDDGVDVRFRVFTARDAPTTFAVGLSPALGVAVLGDGRHRLPSILHVLLPEVGVSVGIDLAPALYLEVARFPYTAWLSRYVGLEVQVGVWIGRPPWDPDGTFGDVGVTTSLGIAFRSDPAPSPRVPSG